MGGVMVVVGKMQIALPNRHLQHFGDAKEELRFLQLVALPFLTHGFEQLMEGQSERSRD